MIVTKKAAAAAALAFTAPAALAQGATPSDQPTELAPVVVTANPLGSALFDLAAPVSVLGGRDLTLRRESTLGETVANLPGVSSTYFGPSASRPVIRGLDSDRIRILQNGTGMLDVSALSPDHATTVDPLVVDRIEVVRGPAALLYQAAEIPPCKCRRRHGTESFFVRRSGFSVVRTCFTGIPRCFPIILPPADGLLPRSACASGCRRPWSARTTDRPSPVRAPSPGVSAQ